METTDISNPRKPLSAYLRKVRAGETVVVLDRGRPTARIPPVAGSAADEERIARLEAKGPIDDPTSASPGDFLSVKRPQSLAGPKRPFGALRDALRYPDSTERRPAGRGTPH